METSTDRMPAVYLGHGAPPLVDDERWVAELRRWSADLPKPKQILVVSAHWESAPLTIGATDGKTPLTYDFYGFPQRYYEMTYEAPGAPELATQVRALMPDTETVAEAPDYGMDHGAYVPLLVMYPEHDMPGAAAVDAGSRSRAVCSGSASGCGRCATRVC